MIRIIEVDKKDQDIDNFKCNIPNETKMFRVAG